MRKINKCYPAMTMVGLFCLLALAGLVYISVQAPAAAQQSTSATFDFERFTKNKPFKLNTLPTTRYGPPWADVLDKPAANFLECRGAAIALCYYSGPGPITPCILDGLGIANCTCYEIPRGERYLVDINAILNRDVYLKTVAACGKDGSNCRPTGSIPAPVCEAINNNTLIPGADLISTFSLYLREQIQPPTTAFSRATMSGPPHTPRPTARDADVFGIKCDALRFVEMAESESYRFDNAEHFKELQIVNQPPVTAPRPAA